ncbi:DUF4129 domain-containing protein [Mycobacterium palustre]|uniref:Protein-glutamine gamma-glutamyltransferase-like C-terminal domain-containing protein n=1 Tax=Mycobacterium palustre TaxID=153971 RepID=A0A1X1ZXU0_9MYCO|nr:DUF4129 domain-containing protein [Mycobacterium palustre]MCV7101899.1 DUF4129 domain-containing protein [Mycobacterium palustre]ORW29758.1 hypothetical protein AWC19_25915 [Mycobacterium palustre]
MPSIDVDRDAAHQAALAELGKPIYSKGSAARQFAEWVDELVYRLLEKTASIPGGWLTVTVLAILLAIAVAVAVRVIRRTIRTRRAGDYLLFEAAQLTAAQHRATAESYASQGDWVAAIRHRLRAVARQLEETGVVEPAPGRTANELARDAAAALPHLADELSRAATAFNDVTYGERPGTRAAYQMIVDLDDHLRSRPPAFAPPPGHPAAVESWAQVR